jgi:hypothetical protein
MKPGCESRLNWDGDVAGPPRSVVPLKPVKRTIHFRVFRDGAQYSAECLDLPVPARASSLDELALKVQEGVGMYLEGGEPNELGFAADPVIILTIELELPPSGEGSAGPGEFPLP